LFDIDLDPDVDLDSTARIDALHDMSGLEDDDIDFDADTQRQPIELSMLGGDATVGPYEHTVRGDEPYDAVDAEDVGATWLRRATQQDPSDEPDVAETLEGTHAIVDGDSSLFSVSREASLSPLGGLTPPTTSAFSPTAEENARHRAALEANGPDPKR
jgi:hypothetical protein